MSAVPGVHERIICPNGEGDESYVYFDLYRWNMDGTRGWAAFMTVVDKSGEGIDEDGTATVRITRDNALQIMTVLARMVSEMNT